MGLVVCAVCKIVIREDPRFEGISHTYCGQCYKIAAAEAEAFIAGRTGELTDGKRTG